MSILAAYIMPHPPLAVPAVGRGQEGKIKSTLDAFEKTAKEIGDLNPDTLLIITPHSIIYSDYLHISPGPSGEGDFSMFGDNTVKIRADYDRELVNLISDLAYQEGLAGGTLGERDKKLDHGVLVPLYFIEKHLKDFKLVRMGVSGLSSLDHYNFGKLISKAAESLGRRVVVVGSGDLSHRLLEEGPYSYAPEGPIFDERVTKAMATGDFLDFFRFTDEDCDAAGECGLRSFLVMAGALDGLAVEANLLSYEGPYGVGYAVASFHPKGKDATRHFDLAFEKERDKELAEVRQKEGDLVALARKALENYVKTRKYIKADDSLAEELKTTKAGTFVTIKKDGKLRGCIGTIEASRKNLAEEIINNAVSAGTGDPRFDPVTEEELDQLVYSVDVLGQAEEIDSKEMLDPKNYGVIVSKGSKRGLLLPNLEGVNTIDEQLEIVLQKAGISERDKYKIERFQVVRHK